MIGILNLQALRNATFDEVNFQISIDDTFVNLTGCVIKMQVKKNACSSPLLSLTSVDSAGITITNANVGEFKINEQIINLPACDYEYDIQITFVDGSKKTYVGGLFQVVKTITN
jgi:hypothetical protein